MTDKDFSDRVDKSMVTLKIIWGGMIFSLLMYLGLGLYLAEKFRGGLSDPGTVTMLRAILFAASLVSLAASKILRVKTFARARAAGRARGQEHEGVNLRAVLGVYATATIISLALAESVGIYGLILSLLGGSTTDLFILVGLGVAAMVHYRPRSEEVMALATGREPGGGGYRSAQRD